MIKIATDIPVKWVYALFLLLSLVLYGNSIPNNYGLDDGIVVSDNPAVQRGFAGIKEILNQPYINKAGIRFDFRPVVMTSFALEYQFFSANPHVSHLINVLLYALCLVLLYNLLVYVFELEKLHKLLPLAIVFLYAVHPIHTEVVDSLKNRDELLSMLFGLLLLENMHKFNYEQEKRWKYLALSSLSLVFMMYSKFSGIVFIGFYFLSAIFFGYFKKSKLNYLFLLLCLLVVAALIIRIFEGSNRETNILENPLLGNRDIWLVIGTSFKVLMYHIKMLILPSIFRFYYGYNTFPLVGIADVYALVSLVLHVSALLAGIILFFRKQLLGIFILFYFVAIFLYSNLFTPYTGVFSERALFVSSFWFIAIILILTTWGIERFKRYTYSKTFKFVLLFFFLLISVVYSCKTIARNFYWKDTLTLMGHDIQYLDRSVLANYMYANNLKEADGLSGEGASRELAELATVYYKKSIALVPSYPEFYFKIASTYRYNLKRMDSAEVYYKKVIDKDSLYATAYLELGKLYLERKDFKKSTLYLSNAYLINPTDSVTMYYYAQSASDYGDLQTSYTVNKKFVEQYPHLPVAYVNLGVCYSRMLKDDSAVVNFEKAVQLGYREPQLLQQMVVYFDKKGNQNKSLYYKNLSLAN